MEVNETWPGTSETLLPEAIHKIEEQQQKRLDERYFPYNTPDMMM